MRILMVVFKYPPPVLGGLERQAHELAKALVENGHTVYVVSTQFDSGHSSKSIIDGVHVHRAAWGGNNKLGRFTILPFGFGWRLIYLMRRVDVVHVHLISWFGAFAVLLAKIFGMPVITKLANIGEYGLPGIRRRLFGGIRTRLLKMSDAIIAMTPESILEIADVNYPAKRILKVPNGIAPLPPNTERRPPQQSSDSVTVVFVGRLCEQKGVIDLLYAWQMVLQDAKSKVRLHLVGDGPISEEMKSLSHRLGLDNSVKFCGYCPDVVAELSKADIFVLPSYVEGNSNAILEAMRSALPIVATRVGGSQFQVGREGQPYLLEPGDHKALSERLLTLIQNKTLRTQLGEAMQQRIDTLFSINRVASLYEQAYTKLAAGQRSLIGKINKFPL